jgi:hypothetical protein
MQQQCSVSVYSWSSSSRYNIGSALCFRAVEIVVHVTQHRQKRCNCCNSQRSCVSAAVCDTVNANVLHALAIKLEP